MAKIADIIKYEGDNKTFVWKHPCEDFNNLTQLIVHESQEAIFFMNGQALDVFTAGRYTLETENLPILGKMLNRTTGNVSPFHCEVYFINKTIQMAIKWGVGNVGYMEPTYNFPLVIGAGGELILKVENGKKLLLKLVGTENLLLQEKLVSFFRGILATKVKSVLAKTIKKEKINIFEIDERLDDLSENLLHFRQYADITDAKIRQQVDIIDEQTKAQKMLIESQALATKRVQEGYTYQQERSFDVASDVAKNEASGQFTNMGIGIGTMAGVGGVVGGMLNQTMGNLSNSQSQEISCANCGTRLPSTARFCYVCGNKIEPTAPTKNVCMNCGADLPNGSKFCLQCGNRVE